jgi:hypothetical protein
MWLCVVKEKLEGNFSLKGFRVRKEKNIVGRKNKNFHKKGKKM